MLNFKYPFSAIGHHLEDEVFDLLKEANKTMKTYTQGYYQEKFEKETKSIEQILIRSGEGKLAGMDTQLAGMGIYKSQEDFDGSSKMLKIMFMGLEKSFDGIFFGIYSPPSLANPFNKTSVKLLFLSFPLVDV